MKLLLTGATGFLGSHLLKAFLNVGIQVVVLKRGTSSVTRIAALMDRVETADVDRTTTEALFAAYPDCNVVVHAATTYGHGEPLAKVAQTNVVWPLELLEQLKHRGGTFVNTDTCFTKGRNYSYLKGYTTTKALLVELAGLAAAGTSVRLVNMKLEHPYGPGDSQSKFATSIIRGCLQNMPSIELTPGLQERDFIYVDDVSNAYVEVLRAGLPPPGEFAQYEVGTGKSLSIREFVTRVRALTASSTELRFGAIPYRDGEIMRSCADLTNLQRIGFNTRWTLDDGLRATIQAERERMSSQQPTGSIQ